MFHDSKAGQTNYCTHPNQNTSGICDDCCTTNEPMKTTWGEVICSHIDGYHSDCFGCGWRFCKEHTPSPEECNCRIPSKAIQSAKEEERERIRKEIFSKDESVDWNIEVYKLADSLINK